MSARWKSSYVEDIGDLAATLEYKRPSTEYLWRRHKGMSDGHEGREYGAREYGPHTASVYSKDFEEVVDLVTSSRPTEGVEGGVEEGGVEEGGVVEGGVVEEGEVGVGGEQHATPRQLAYANKIAQTRPPREHPVLCANPIRSTGHRDYGELGYVPSSSLPRHPKEISLRASSVDLAAGTTKPTNHVPGYTGFLPADEHNVHARVQGVANYTRRSEKSSSTLNVGREMVPGYAGYRPTTPAHNTNRTFQMYRQSEYADSFYRKPQSAASVKQQLEKRATFARLVNPWNHAPLPIS